MLSVSSGIIPQYEKIVYESDMAKAILRCREREREREKDKRRWRMKIVVHHYRQTQFSRLTTGVKAEGEVDTQPLKQQIVLTEGNSEARSFRDPHVHRIALDQTP